MCNGFQDILIDASKKSLKIRKKKNRCKITNVANKKWFDKECRFQRHELRKLSNQKHKNPTNQEIRNSYQTALRTYKRTLQNKKHEFQQNKIEEIIRATENDPKSFWKTLKNASDSTDDNANSNNTPSGGELLTHFKNLHNEHTSNENNKELLETLKDNETRKHLHNKLDTEITDHEIINASKNIKTKKVVYLDQISNEMIKTSIDILIKGFNKTFNTILTSGQFPSSWCGGLITPIYKAGSRADPNNYRGICVSSSLGKFFRSILNERLTNFVKEKK